MKKLTFITVIIFTANLLFAQFNKIDTSFFSQALGEEKMVDVYFPPGYDENPDLYYPVIYYLHAWFGDQNTMGEMLSWTQSLINNGTIEPVIMVGADNSPDPFDGSMYTNSILWGNYEDYMINDLISWIESSFRAVPSRNYRALLGHSMGGYGAFRYGTLHKDKFRVLAATASAILNLTDSYLEYSRQKIMEQNQPGPPFFYDYDSTGSTTKGLFLFCGAFSPNLNTPQTYINPPVVEFAMNENGNWIDTIAAKMKNNSIDHFIHQLSQSDSVGILFGCGSADEAIYPPHIAFKDTLDLLGLPYEFYDHDGGHIMPSGFKERALIFIDSLIMGPLTGINKWYNQNDCFEFSIFPNPANETSLITYDLAAKEKFSLSICDITGKEIKQISLGVKDKGLFKLDCRNFSPGIYFVILQIETGILPEKMIIE